MIDFRTGKNLVVFISRNDSFTEVSYNSFINGSNVPDNMKFLILKQDGEWRKTDNWRLDIVLYIEEIKDEYDFVLTVGPTVVFNAQENINKIMEIHHGMVDNGLSVVAPSYFDKEYDESYLQGNFDQEYVTIKTLFNMDSYLRSDLILFNTYQIARQPSISMFYNPVDANKTKDFLLNSVFLFYKLNINPEKVYTPTFFEMNDKSTRKKGASALKADILVGKEKYIYEPFKSVDGLCFQHLVQFQLLHENGYKNEIFESNYERLNYYHMVLNLEMHREYRSK